MSEGEWRGLGVLSQLRHNKGLISVGLLQEKKNSKWMDLFLMSGDADCSWKLLLQQN